MTDHGIWARVDAYVDELAGADPDLDATRARSAEAGLPDIAVSPAQGRWLTILARATGARRVLEIGTLGGYSTICLARGVADGGRVVTLEIEPRHAEVARANVEDAGLAGRVDIRLGPAADTLRTLAAEGARYDLAFIDADKEGYPTYLALVRPLVRPGGLIIADNVVRGGAVVPPGGDANARAVREYLDLVSRDQGLLATVLQTVGAKGHDGFSVALVLNAGGA
ncbi:MAG: O-methyltransferase [Vicinamibacterales bacterium]